MVEVFTEVKRVLKKEGSLWLNLGDSYSSGRSGQNFSVASGSTAAGRTDKEGGFGHINNKRNPKDIGLKPKDLIGIPWMVAKALQQSQYTGRIKKEADRIWLAAMIDGEGCMFIHKRKAGTSNHSKYTKKDGTISEYGRKNDTYGAGLEVANTHLSIIQRCMDITGVGSICTVERETALKKRNIPLHRWNVRSNECRWIVEEIYPYLVGKQQEARLLLGCPSSGEMAEKAHRGLMELHNGRIPDIDFPAPKPLYEQGWWLRQDIIWHKLNPMPESVTDRCTKAHEYIFLLSKSGKYYYDHEAIKQGLAESSVQRLSQQIELQEGSDRVPGKTNGKMKAVRPHGVTRDRLLDYDSKEKELRPNTKRGGAEKESDLELPEIGANKRSVWTVTTKPYKESHFATFPEELIVDMIKAGCPERKFTCSCCGFDVNLLESNTKANETIYEELQGMWHRVSGSRQVEQGKGFLQPEVQFRMDGKEQGINEGLDNLQQGVQNGCGTGTPKQNQVWLHDGAPLSNGKETRAVFGEMGGCSPQGPQQIEQQNIESRTTTKGSPRQTSETPNKIDRLSALWEENKSIGACPKCSKGELIGRRGLILDCFMGAGTTALVASKLNRNFIGFELNAEYIKIAKMRLQNELGMFNTMTA
jgi:DNA modification methylase